MEQLLEPFPQGAAVPELNREIRHNLRGGYRSVLPGEARRYLTIPNAAGNEALA